MERPIFTLLLRSVLVLWFFLAYSPARADDEPDPELAAQGKILFQSKICFTCHQVDPEVPTPAGAALKAPPFMGDFWGAEREVQIDANPDETGFQDSGKTEKVKLDDAYFLESVEKPFAKVLKGAIPGMAPLPTTPEERKALLAYVKSLSGATPAEGPSPVAAGQPTPEETPKAPPPPLPEAMSAAASEGAKIFGNLCTACHTIGRGKLVGPDLAGVTERREEGWLKRQIKDPLGMIAEEDPIAMELLKESNNVPMAPLGLNDTQISAVIAYLRSTEQLGSVPVAVPSQYAPTILVSLAALGGLTLIGLKAGSKKVDVR